MTTIGQDVEKRLKLLREKWNSTKLEMLLLFDGDVKDGLLAAIELFEFSFMDQEAWNMSYNILLQHRLNGLGEFSSRRTYLWRTRSWGWCGK